MGSITPISPTTYFLSYFYGRNDTDDNFIMIDNTMIDLTQYGVVNGVSSFICSGTIAPRRGLSITGTGTTFTTDLQVNDNIVCYGQNAYVTSVVDDTHVTIATQYTILNNWVLNGAATMSAADFMFGTQSLLSSTTTSYVTLTQGDYFGNATPTNWTLEFFFNFTSVSTNQAMVISNSPFSLKITYVKTSSRLNISLGSNGTSYNIANGATTSTTFPTAGVWHHFAIVYNGVNYRVFTNGTLASTIANDTPVSAACLTSVKFGADGSTSYTGYIDELRISNVARYSTAFTPTASAFTYDTNTIALNHFEGSDIIDADDCSNIQFGFLRGQYGPDQVVYVYAMGHATVPGYLATTLSHVEFNAVIKASMVPPGYDTAYMRQTPLAIPIQPSGTPFYVTTAGSNFYLINPQPVLFTVTSTSVTTYTCPQVPVIADSVKLLLTFANNSASANPVYIGPAGITSEYRKLFDTNIMFSFIQSVYVRVVNQQFDARLTTAGSTCIVQLEGWYVSTDV